jgi:hypothetical protein
MVISSSLQCLILFPLEQYYIEFKMVVITRFRRAGTLLGNDRVAVPQPNNYVPAGGVEVSLVKATRVDPA